MRYQWYRGIISGFLLVMFLSVAMLSAQEPDGEEDRSWCVSVWYPSSENPTGYDSLMANLDVIDEVNPFWYSPNLDGTLFLRIGAEDEEKLAAWREADLKILPTIATTGAAGMIETPEARAAHIAAIVDRVEDMDYDGIDIDYEGFALDTREPFSIFMEDLADALHANDRLVSMAVHAKTADVAEWDAATAQDWPRLTKAVDIFRIMTYDYHNRAGEPGAIAPTPWVEDVLAYASTVTDLGKVRMGLHFYGLSWRRGGAAVVTWFITQQWINSFDVSVERHPDDLEASFVIQAPGLPHQTVYIADAVSLDYKLEQILARYPDLGGVAIWGMGGEDPENWEVLRNRGGACLSFNES